MSQLCDVYECSFLQVGELVVCEHDPVFTFGLRQADYQAEAARLRLLGCEVHKVIWVGVLTTTCAQRASCLRLSLCTPPTGEERWADYLPRPRAVGVLSCPEFEATQGLY